MSARPTSPHERLTALDAAGEAYWIERRTLGKSMACQPSGILNVTAHGPEWVEVVTESHQVTMWIRWADLGPFEIVES